MTDNSSQKRTKLIVDPTIEYYCSPVTKSTGFTKLHRLCLIDPIHDTDRTDVDLGKIQKYLRKHDNINCRNTAGWTPLMLAVRNGWTRVVRLLLGLGADAKLVNNKKWSALEMCAAATNSTSNTDILKLLLQYDINQTNKDNALQKACRNIGKSSTMETVELLYAAGANPANGGFEWAIRRFNIDLVKLFMFPKTIEMGEYLQLFIKIFSKYHSEYLKKIVGIFDIILDNCANVSLNILLEEFVKCHDALSLFAYTVYKRQYEDCLLKFFNLIMAQISPNTLKDIIDKIPAKYMNRVIHIYHTKYIQEPFVQL